FLEIPARIVFGVAQRRVPDSARHQERAIPESRLQPPDARLLGFPARALADPVQLDDVEGVVLDSLPLAEVFLVRLHAVALLAHPYELRARRPTPLLVEVAQARPALRQRHSVGVAIQEVLVLVTVDADDGHRRAVGGLPSAIRWVDQDVDGHEHGARPE